MSSQQLQWFTKLRFHQQNLQSGDLQLCLLVSTPEISTINPQLCLFFPPNCQNPTKSHGISMKYTFNHHKKSCCSIKFQLLKPRFNSRPRCHCGWSAPAQRQGRGWRRHASPGTDEERFENDRLIDYQLLTIRFDYSLIDHQWLIDQTTSSTAQGGGGSFRNRTPERLVVVNHGWQSESTDGPRGAWCLLSFSLSLSFSDYLPTYLPIYLTTYVSIYPSTYLSIYLSLSLFHLSICLAV